ncbi:MAG: hypothetical protein L6R00_16510, partial [Phycisphaerae bacterium]|nr:hypothetical protein [Phycisphaerae bacterium]
RNTLQFLYPLRLRHTAAQARQNVHVILHAADLNRRTLKPFAYAAQVGMQRRSNAKVAKEGASLLCGKNQVDVNG